jgi:hypothetical protein
MNKEEIRSAIYRLREERRRIETILLNTARQLPVWITSQYTYCKKGNCKCTRGQPHGPFYYVFFKKANKVVHRYLPEKKLDSISAQVNAYKGYNQRIARINKINKEIEDLLKQHQKNNLQEVPKWITEKKKTHKGSKASGGTIRKITRK